MADNQKGIDYRLFLVDEPCDIAISGNEEQLLEIAVHHAVHDHGQQDTPALREGLRLVLGEERRRLKAA
jgi:hypothetical protein